MLLLHLKVGQAQDSPFTETPTTSPTETSFPEETATLTESATPVSAEAEVSSTPTVEVQEGDTVARLLIKKSVNARLENVMRSMNTYGHVLESTELGKLGVFVLEVPASQVNEKILEIRNLSGVEWVEPDYPLQALDTFPNDPLFSQQYALSAIRAPQGWDISTGSMMVTIAILDTGVDLTHPDLEHKILPGYDFVNGDSVPQDDAGHGTHVAGIAAALGNNGIGIAGVSWGARILPVKVLDSAGRGTALNVAEGIVWAADQGAQVINLSLGGSQFSQTLQDAVLYAEGRGVLLIASSGNTNSNFVLYPARFPQVMAVAATDASNQRASFSNYGDEIEIAAPGVSILSLYPGGYNTLSGTSMSAPHVSGLAAILIGQGYDATSARDRIKNTALDIPPSGFDIYTGAGLMQMDAALQVMITPTEPTETQTIQSAFTPPLVFPSPLWTFTPLATPTPVLVTSTLSLPITQTVSPSPLPLRLDETKTLPATSQIEALSPPTDIPSPYFCFGILFVVLGILILCITRRMYTQKKRFW